MGTLPRQPRQGGEKVSKVHRTTALGAVALAALSLCGAPRADAVAQTPPGRSGAAAQEARLDDPEAFWHALAARPGISPEAMEKAVRDVPAQSMSQRRNVLAAHLAQALGGGITGGEIMAAFERARAAGTAPDRMVDAVASSLGVTPAALGDALHRTLGHGRAMGTRGRGPWLVVDAAHDLGMRPADLVLELAKGTTLAQAAAARGKSTAGLEVALRRAAAKRIHAAMQVLCPPRPRWRRRPGRAAPGREPYARPSVARADGPDTTRPT